MKKLNKKGFTLVELLAVIVVLAVIMLLAVNAVIPQMNKARKNAFVTEAQRFIDAAGTYYQSAILSGETGFDVTGGCVKVEDLIGDYVEKDNADDYSGSVDINIVNGQATYTIWLSNGSYYLSADGADNAKAKGITSGGLNEGVVSAGTATAPVDCKDPS